ncbi:MAG: hypothetical protein NDF54_07320 [archaeon GB-1867-035]|nr:hypothetical protein [Candidatus Culexmicrobium profundum]
MVDSRWYTSGVGVDFETSDIFAGIAIAFSAHGTAVIVEKLDE